MGKIPGSFLKRKAVPPTRPFWCAASSTAPSVLCSPRICATMFPSSAPLCPWTRTAPPKSPLWWVLPSPCPSPSAVERTLSLLSVGLIDGEFVINPNAERQGFPDGRYTVASTDSRIAMIEAGATRFPTRICTTALSPVTRPTSTSLNSSRALYVYLLAQV